MASLIIYTKEGHDEASGSVYHVTVMPSEAMNSINPNAHGLSIDSMIVDDFCYDTYMTSHYNIHLSGGIQLAHRQVLTGFLHGRDVPLAACKDTASLIFQAYGLDSSSCFQVKNIQARVQIETYYEMPTPDLRDVVEALEKVMIRAGAETTSCVVCLEEFSVGYEATKMPCSHVFHGDCIVRWLENRFDCPLCRFELTSDERTNVWRF